MSEVTAIIGSPRKNGNCQAIVGKMVDTLKAEGNNVNVFYLNDIEAKGCQACYGCKKDGKCVRKDGLTPVLDAVKNSDSIIVATPDYFGQPCSQYRMFEDRLYGFVGMNDKGEFVSNLPAGKKVATVVTSGSGAGADNIADSMARIFNGFLKCDVIGNLDYREGPNGPARDNAEAMKEAEALAKKL